MKKYCKDLVVKSVEHISAKNVLIRLTQADPLPEILPGQFVEIRVDHSPATFLRRPISIHFVDREANELWLMVAVVGEGTRQLATLREGDALNIVFPLGNGFTVSSGQSADATPLRCLLVGGGVGIAPLLELGKVLSASCHEVTYVLGGRTADDLQGTDVYNRYGRVYYTTEDGSLGDKGFVTQHSLLAEEHFDRIYTCGPKPMMVAVAHYAREVNTWCEASLENLMACGLGACLCCVEKTRKGNLCVCKEGPVFNIDRLLWLS
ncbi:MAG: dihydroorotate dehydrogenase electron transfer subunit [Prevotella sp.]|nr:dihydroorotate dehydrogenase electron transfer subunit [Prevotella sp.]MBQ9652105.1 dihydroorotate dehydrogenase electron transfer subunit [Prevotella sp.]